MTNILIVGAAGGIAQEAIRLFESNPDCRLTLYLRRASRLAGSPHRVIEGDATDGEALAAAMEGQDVVYANLAGALPAQARAIIDAMHMAGVSRLIFITSMGIYNEVPGETYGGILAPYRAAAEVIATSDLDYTILRPAWLTGGNDIAYGITRKGEPFRNAEAHVSRRSVADLVVELSTQPAMGLRESYGVHRA